MERPVFASALKRCALATLAALALLPAAAHAQLMPVMDEISWGPKLRITPSVGWAPGITREETWNVLVDGTPVIYAVETELAGGPAASLNFEYAVRGPWNVLIGGTYISRDVSGFMTASGEPEGFTSSTSIAVKAGVSLQMRESDSELTLRRLGASAFVAPFFMMEMPDEVAGFEDTDLFETGNHFGVNFGIAGELPFANDRFALQLGLEDYLTFWDETSLARYPAWRFESAAEADADMSHQWLLRAGISFRLR